MREVQPCGTHAAYRRHLNAGEEPCEPCKQASRDQKNNRVEAHRDKSAEILSLAASVEPEVDDVDPLEDALENLRLVRAAMKDGPHNTIAALSKRRQELVALVKQLRSDAKPEVSALDQLAKRRRDRQANSAG